MLTPLGKKENRIKLIYFASFKNIAFVFSHPPNQGSFIQLVFMDLPLHSLHWKACGHVPGRHVPARVSAPV